MQPINDRRASGNPEVQAFFEMWLAKAKEGRMRYAAVIACESPLHVDVDHAGSLGCEFAANFGVDLLKQNIFGVKRPGGSAGLGADFVRYDLSRAPIGWDFASWIIDQEMTRVRQGAPAPLKVAFVGDIGRRRWGPNETQILEKVMRPLIPLIGAVENPIAMQAEVRKEFYMLRYVTEAARKGEEVPQFKAPDAGTVHDYVTITLREADYWPHRNSNLAAWSKLANELRRRGENVVFVRDTAKANEMFEDFLTSAEAALNVTARAKLYAQAKANLFVANGPWSLALFGKRPWLMFNQVSPDDPFDANKPSLWKDFHGIAEGEQFPWSASDQRIIWEADDEHMLLRAWDDLAPSLDQAKAA